VVWHAGTQGISVQRFDYQGLAEDQAKAFWSTLSLLRNLRTVNIDSDDFDISESFFSEVSLLTQIRVVHMRPLSKLEILEASLNYTDGPKSSLIDEHIA
jgi:hypothetical protein